MPTVLLTGASRGLGLEFARQYAKEHWRVIATCRDPAKAAELRAVPGSVEIHPLNATDFATVGRLAATLGGVAIHVLIANAGVIGPRDMTPDAVDAAARAEGFPVNVMAPPPPARAFRRHVAR